jgi:thiol-disulfide isomerase/thioredoxin
MKLSRRILFGLPALLRPAFGANVPRPAGEFEYLMPGDKPELLSQYKGKIVVAEFLFTTCPHCQRCAQVMSSVQREYASKGVQMVGIAYNPEAPGTVTHFAQTFAGNAYPVGYRDRVRVNSYLEVSSVMRNFVPNLVVIDRNWTIRAQYSGDDAFFHNEDKNLRTLIDSLLKEPAGKKKAAR